MFQEHTDAILPGLLNERREVQGVERLLGQGIRDALLRELVGLVGGVGVKPDAGSRGRRGGGSGMHLVPGGFPRREFRAMHHQIVVDALGAVLRQYIRNTRHNVLAFGVDRGEAQLRIRRQNLLEFRWRNRQPPGLPAGFGHLLKEPGGLEFLMEVIQVRPRPERRDGVGLAGTEPDGGRGAQAEHIQRELRMNLAEERTGPEGLVRVRLGVVAENPLRGGGHPGHPGGDVLQEFRKGVEERAAHAPIRRRRACKYKAKLACDRGFAVIDTIERRRQLHSPVEFSAQFGFRRRHDHGARRAI